MTVCENCTWGHVSVSRDCLQEIKQCFQAERRKLPTCLTTQYHLTCKLASSHQVQKWLHRLNILRWQTVNLLKGCCYKLDSRILIPRCHFQLLLLVVLWMCKWCVSKQHPGLKTHSLPQLIKWHSIKSEESLNIEEVGSWIAWAEDLHPGDWGPCPLRSQKWPLISFESKIRTMIFP